MAINSLSEIYCNNKELLFQNLIDSIARNDDDALQKLLLNELIEKYVLLAKRIDALLKNTLPHTVAEEIKFCNRYTPRSFDCTILFADIASFTRLVEHISSEALIDFLHRIFTGFDAIISDCNGTKIKTIGDAYMAIFGAPVVCKNHPVMALKASMAFLEFIESFQKENDPKFQMRIGVHTGRIIAGVVGQERMQFDVFGDDVNIASRFESSGQKGKINVSEQTYLQTRDYFEFEERGMIALKNKESMKAYFLVKPKEV